MQYIRLMVAKNVLLSKLQFYQFISQVSLIHLVWSYASSIANYNEFLYLI